MTTSRRTFTSSCTKNGAVYRIKLRFIPRLRSVSSAKSPARTLEVMKIEILRNKCVYTWAFFHGKGHEHLNEGKGDSLEEVLCQILVIKSVLEEEGNF